MSGARKRGLALSGGGYRASLFHLGAVTRLHELGIAQQLTRISSVSGGSIFAAHLAHCMLGEQGNGKTIDFGSSQSWEDSVAKPFRAFVGKDARTWATIKFAFWGQLNPTLRVNHVRDSYERRLTNKKLKDLPVGDDCVEFVFLATEMSTGTSWRFEPRAMYAYPRKKNSVLETSIATAATASACFPPLFGPMKLETEHSGEVFLTDGGVYDNSAMEPIWKHHNLVLVSDAGQPWRLAVPKLYTAKLMRYAAIATKQVRAQRQRALIAKFEDAKLLRRDIEGTLWRMSSAAKRFEQDGGPTVKNEIEELKNNPTNHRWYGYADDEVLTRIHRIRTDLDVFTDAECKILENHGYFFADLAVRTHLRRNYPIGNKAFIPPHASYLDPQKVKESLKRSHSRMAFWRRSLG